MISPSKLVAIDTATINALCFIQKSSIVFHLTGSRYFGNATDSSDYDFFAAYNQKIENTLQKAGFMLLSEDKYKDSNTTKVYRQGKVDIQLSVDFNKKKKINEWLKENSAIYSLINQGNKKQIRLKWSALFALLD